MKNLQKVALRQNAVFIPAASIQRGKKNMSSTTAVLAANARKLGFVFSEKLTHALNGISAKAKLEILEHLRAVTGVNKNWTPLVKGWKVPTGETIVDHFITFLANVAGTKKGTTLPCGHLIPKNTFPLERYNGCPFCGTPFEFGKLNVVGQGSKQKVLDLWGEEEVQAFLKNLLASKTALDATQVDSLKILLTTFDVPKVSIGIKETLMLVIDTLIEQGAPEKACRYFASPTDILRYLWYKQTGFLQIIEPKTIVKRKRSNHTHIAPIVDKSKEKAVVTKADLRLKYSRKQGRMVAAWMNALPLSATKACEIMHPKRGMWVRFIRALRLAEYSKRAGYENLAKLLEVFYKQDYEVWQAKVNDARMRSDSDTLFPLLQQRPGTFARSLFSNMLWFGAEETTAAFEEVVDKVPARLVLTLNMYAQNYFTAGMSRSVQPLGGKRKNIEGNQLMQLYDEAQLKTMKTKVEDLSILAMKKRFAAISTENKSMYIDPALYTIPLAIGERSESVQDLPTALMGTKFPVEGNEVRLFMQWGTGLKAQHLDMDLSCQIAYANKTERCSYSKLTATGCQHSGDIINIPEKVGTAEYININISQLAKAGAKYVTFTCNAYSRGSITPNLVIGWMNSRHPMKISEKTGVAYDPSCIQHQVRVTQQLTKGLVFGVLDVAAKEIIWLEMPFGGQVVQNLNFKGVKTLLAKLESRMNIGALLEVKAAAQGLVLVDAKKAAEADEVYDVEWAQDTAKVTALLVD